MLYSINDLSSEARRQYSNIYPKTILTWIKSGVIFTEKQLVSLHPTDDVFTEQDKANFIEFLRQREAILLPLKSIQSGDLWKSLSVYSSGSDS